MDMLASILPAGIAVHAPALIVVIPLIMAAVAALMPRGAWAWGVTLATAIAVAVLALNILGQVSGEGVISYAVGGWAPPVGIELRVDMLNVPLLLLVGLVGLLCVIYALPSVADEIAKTQQSLFYSAFLVCFAGLLGVSVTAMPSTSSSSSRYPRSRPTPSSPWGPARTGVP